MNNKPSVTPLLLSVTMPDRYSKSCRFTNKKVRDRSHAPKNATPIVAKQILNTKGQTLLSFKWNCVFTEFILNDKGKRV